MARFKESEGAVKAPVEKAMELGLANKAEEATKILMKEVRPIQRKWLTDLDEFAAFEEKLNDTAVSEAEQAYNAARTLMLSCSGIAVLLGIVSAFLITRSLLVQLGGEPSYAREIAQQVASGNLAIDVKTKFHANVAMRNASPRVHPAN